MSKICKALNNFFGVEIRNEDDGGHNHGGVKPATLFSALDSWRQAPIDIREAWSDTKKTRGLNTKIRKLISKYGRNKELRNLVY